MHVPANGILSFFMQELMYHSGFLDSSVGKESACKARDLGLIPGFGRSPGEWKGYPLQYSGLENFMDFIVHGIAKSRTRVSESTATTPVHSLTQAVC